MSKRDYYEVLGVSRTCTEADLKVAFRKAAMQHHPDRNPGDSAAELKFKELNEAYQCLSDGQKRAAYDRFGHAAFENGGGGQGGFGADGFASSMADIFDDLFGGMRGGRARSNGGRERGADLRYNMEITLEDAFTGKQAEIRVPTSVDLRHLRGLGREAGLQAAPVRDVRRPRARARATGLLRHRAHLSDPARAGARSSKTPARPARAPGASCARRTFR